MPDSKVHSLTETTTPATADEVYVVVDPTGTPADRRSKLQNLPVSDPTSAAISAAVAGLPTLVTTVHGQTATTTPATTDEMFVVLDPAGTPTGRRVLLRYLPVSDATTTAINAAVTALPTLTAADASEVGLSTVGGTTTLTLLTPIARSRLAVSSKTGAWTPALGDELNKLFVSTDAGATTITLPADASVNFPTGSQVPVIQGGTGQLTFATDGTSIVAGTPTLKTRAQYALATAIKVSTNSWIVVGDMAAS